MTLEIDSADADVSGYEPVWSNGQKVGFITSGGYGHYTGKSLAMALINRDKAEPGTELTVHVVGVERPARVVAPSASQMIDQMSEAAQHFLSSSPASLENLKDARALFEIEMVRLAASSKC